MVKICTGCDTLNTQELGLNSNGEPYLACCPDNNYVEVTGVEWYRHKIMKILFSSDDNTLIYETDIFEKAKEIEKFRSVVTENTSDGFHTFKILYEIRKAYNVALFNEWAIADKYNVHKSRKHNDGEYPFGNDNWFIVCAELPNGQISNHYTMDNWDLFKIPEYTRALLPFDGHDTIDVIDRLLKLNK